MQPFKLTLLTLSLACASSHLLAAGSNTAVPPAVRPFDHGEVQLLDSPFKQAMERNANYLLSLEPDRLLHNTRKYCGLEPKGELYGGWEAMGIAGHSLGHYLTAIAQQYAATGDERFRKRIDYIVAEMAECQKAYGDGYIGALPPKELETMRAFERGVVAPESGFFFKGGAWVPWYTQHKILAGLIDAWTLGGNAQAKQVTLGLADWTDRITKNLTPAQQQQMLRVEHGGMLESLAQLYALTGEERYLAVSRRFYHHAIFDPLQAGRDQLNGQHANTQIPKIVGAARTYEVTGDADGRKISEFFWDTVVNRRSWVIGGNSDGEHFFPVDQAGEHLSPAAAESCNTYNMLRLTERLFSWEPKPAYADYYERALYNQILPSQEPERGMFTYFVSLKPGHFKTYSTPTDSFWCCVGSGMENHTKYGRAIYFHDDHRLFVNLFIPSSLTWTDRQFELEQKTDYPERDFSELIVRKAPAQEIAINARCPGWLAGPAQFELNGKLLQVDGRPGQFASIQRIWKTGDRLRVTLPMQLRAESLSGSSNQLAFLYGPLVLAGDFGPVPHTKTFPYAADQGANFRANTATATPLILKEGAAATSLLERVSPKELTFQVNSTGDGKPVTLKPFKDIFYNYYNLYWRILTPPEWEQQQATLKAAEELRRAEERRIVDVLNPGEQQSEIDHKIKTNRSESGDFRDRKWRHALAGGYFEFQMKVLPGEPQLLRMTYWGDDAGREFDILINDHLLATQNLERNRPGEFFNVEHPIPPGFIVGSSTITVRLQPREGSLAGGLFECAVLRAN